MQTAAGAEAYPSRPIRMIVPFSPGGGSDAIARLVAPRMTETLGQQVIVDNRPGGNTVIGVRLVGTARPDGYTVLLANANFTINAALYEKLPYDPIRDFTAVTPLASVANVLVVHAGVPAKSVKELIALVKSKPGQLNLASPGAGTSSHMAGVLLKALAQLDFEMVLYKGAGPAVTDLIGGQVAMAVAAMSSIGPHVKSGRLRALGVTTEKRSVLMPDLPTIAESGIPGYEVTNWFGVLAAAGMPPAILTRLEATISGIVRDAEFQRAMSLQGTEPLLQSRPQFERFIRAEVVKWAKLGKDFNLRVE
jgi:tripartite-type tricarboxylate transporter receptor subunit TctC